MLTITIQSYDESSDRFNCEVVDDVAGASYTESIGAFLMPYIAGDLYDEDEDGEAPFGMVGKTFVLRSDFDELSA